jgi:thiosulfate/3-mercaptopyruvate sulfurtransferase
VYTTLVSTTQLATEGGDWVVVDCRFDLKDEAAGESAYRSGHIPGAVYAHLVHHLSGPPTGTNGRHPLPTRDALATTFSAFGIDGGRQVVAYDANNGMFASRLWWLLRFAGHKCVAVLDGGFDTWSREGRPVRQGDEHRARAVFTPAIQPAAVVTLEEMLAGVASGALLVDARAPERFEGRSETLDRVAGHIPGARNRFFAHNVGSDGTFRPAAELRAEFNALFAGRPASEVVMYCGSGVTAC